MPSAQFVAASIPLDTVYTSILTSNPIKANELATGDIFLDFNFKLVVVSDTSLENLLVEVSNDAGNSWTQVAELWSQANIEFADGFHHINITSLAMGHIFQVRFKATGKNTADITSWFVDNIHVYRSCAAPDYLEGTYVWYANDWGAEIEWEAPEIPTPCAMWLFWDIEVYVGGVGVNAGDEWSLAQRWDAGQLVNWNGVDLSGTLITKMSFVLNDDGFSSITLKIWSGPNAETLLYEEAVTNPYIGGWSEVTLDEPVAFDVEKELWIGYTIHNQPTGMFPGGYDAGPAVVGYGDMILTNGTSWGRLSDQGIDNNWLVHAFLEDTVSSTSAQNVGFNLYRQEVEVDDDYVLYDFVAHADGQITYSYYDKSPTVTAGQTYNYQVTAVWEKEGDTCESAPAWSYDMSDNYVSVLVTDVENKKEQEIILYPNPVVHQLHISSGIALKNIAVFNIFGQLILEQKIHNEKNFSVNTAALRPGIYLVRIKTDERFITRSVVIGQ